MAALTPPMWTQALLIKMIQYSLLIGLAWLIAHIFWLLFRPASPAITPDVLVVNPINAANLISRRQSFGVSSDTPNAPKPKVTAAVPVKTNAVKIDTSSLRLVGVISGSPGAAIFDVGKSRQQTVLVGQPVNKQLELKTVANNHVELVDKTGGLYEIVFADDQTSSLFNDSSLAKTTGKAMDTISIIGDESPQAAPRRNTRRNASKRNRASSQSGKRNSRNNGITSRRQSRGR